MIDTNKEAHRLSVSDVASGSQRFWVGDLWRDYLSCKEIHFSPAKPIRCRDDNRCRRHRCRGPGQFSRHRRWYTVDPTDLRSDSSDIRGHRMQVAAGSVGAGRLHLHKPKRLLVRRMSRICFAEGSVLALTERSCHGESCDNLPPGSSHLGVMRTNSTQRTKPTPTNAKTH